MACAAALVLLAMATPAAASSASGEPPAWDPELYCAAKQAAWEFAKELLPERGALP